jgi:hypothetical protein
MRLFDSDAELREELQRRLDQRRNSRDILDFDNDISGWVS